MPKILVVEDSPTIQAMIASQLEDGGHEVVTATNGVEGLSQVSEKLPDLIITDVLMPEMDGFTFYKELKQMKDAADIPVLVLTSRGKMVDTFEVLGVDGFIEKPCEQEELLARVADCLKKSSKTSAPAAASSKKDGRQPVTRAVIAGSEDILEQMELELRRKGCDIFTAFKEEDIAELAKKHEAELVVMDAVIDGSSTNEAVKQLRSEHELKGILIVIFTSFDKDKLDDGDSTHQKVMDVQNAKTLCLNAGATGSIGGFDKESFPKKITEFLMKEPGGSDESEDTDC